MKVIVVGAGSFGSWSALKLQQAGCEVTLVDAWGPGNSRSSSGGETRVIRTVYGHDELYIDMAHQSIEQWSHFQKKADQPLMEIIGSLWFCGQDDSYVQAAMPRIKALGLTLEEYTAQQASSRWSQVDFHGINRVFLEPLAGFLRARLACQAITTEFMRLGGQFLPGNIRPPAIDIECHQVVLETGETLTADQIVLAAGPWLTKLAPSALGQSIEVTKQEVYYFGTPPGSVEFDSGHFPIWLDLNQPIYYGIPSVDRRGFKLALDERGEVFDPDVDSRIASAELVDQARNYLGTRFPRLNNSPLIESRVCQYSNTPDGHFVLDRLTPSGVVVVGGGSGHGFKMGPVIGDRVVQLVQQDTRDPIFGLQRFNKLNETTTQFDHS